MEFINQFVELFLHLDDHLANVVSEYGPAIYIILFLIIFCETGLVVTPILPGDSLLFAAGSMAAIGALNAHGLFVLLTVAAILGDTVNYVIGRKLGTAAFVKYPKIFRPEYLEKTQRFYAKYGGKTIIIARFVPIVRTFAPFVAGVGAMNYGRFIMFNVVGGIVWVSVLVYAGFFFGNIPVVKDHFELVILGIIFLSILPPIIEFAKHHFGTKASRNAKVP